MNLKTPVLLSYAFRPFFLLGSAFAILAVLLWILFLNGIVRTPMTALWHGHEMLVGFVMAMVAGFSLTAVSVWTGRPTVSGLPIAWLVLCWISGRLAMALTHWLPTGLVAALDMLFPVLLCILLGREVIAGSNKRNYVIVIITALLALLNGLYHLGASGLVGNGQRISVYLLIHIIALLVTVIAGRIIPSFTANWLRQQGVEKLPVTSTAVDLVAVILTLLVGLTQTFMPVHILTGILAFAAALVHGFRLSRWCGPACVTNPLLFVLHVAYGWLPVAYVLMGCAVFGWWVTGTAALHALTMGAIGSMVLAVTTRVALGHTGRPLQAARVTVMSYYLLMIAVLLRVLGPLAGENYLLMVNLSAAGWILAFAIFLWVYWPVLSRQRATPSA